MRIFKTLCLLLILSLLSSCNSKMDQIHVAFKDDPQVIGCWESVDFVSDKSKFNPAQKKWKGKLSLKALSFQKNGKTDKPYFSWSKGLLFHQGDKTFSHYEIKMFGKEQYMFLEWMSGDVTIRKMKPKLYVLEKKKKKNPSPERKIWIEKMTKRLSSFKPSKTTPLAKFTKPTLKGKSEISCEIHGRGLIKIKNNVWIFIITHSVHDGPIGDISLAVDSAGQFHINDGHVCGGIHFNSSKGLRPKSIQDFFKNFPAWIKGWKWRKLAINSPENK